MTVAATSIESFNAMIPTQKQAMQTKIYGIICAVGPCSNHTISKILDTEINRITPRVHELRELGKVKEAGKEFDVETKRYVMTWEAI